MSVGYGRPVDDPALPALTAKGTAVFGDAVRLMADALGIDIDEKLAAQYPVPDQPAFDYRWGSTRRRDGTVIRP